MPPYGTPNDVFRVSEPPWKVKGPPDPTAKLWKVSVRIGLKPEAALRKLISAAEELGKRTGGGCAIVLAGENCDRRLGAGRRQGQNHQGAG